MMATHLIAGEDSQLLKLSTGSAKVGFEGIDRLTMDGLLGSHGPDVGPSACAMVLLMESLTASAH